MASQSQVYDEIYAQRSSEFIDRQRKANEEYAKRQNKEQSKRMKAIRELVTKAYATERKVRLHHPSTRRQIGEAVKVHYKSDSVMMFELINHPGKMLRVNASGKVEFAPVQDDTAVFELEAIYSGNLYLLCTAYRDRDNTLSGKGWYLSMSQQGHLTGNGGKCEQSQWLLLEEAPPVPDGVVGADGSTTMPSGDNAGDNTGNSSGSGVLASQTNPIMQQSTNGAAVLANGSTNSGVGTEDAGADGTFPGVGAGREILMKYFLTKSGVKFLQQPEYAAAYALYLKNGALSKILHRPDWPLVANRFVDHASIPFPPLRRSVVDATLSYADLKSFFECGFVVARSVIGPEQGVAAQKMANYWLSKYIYSTRGDASGASAAAASASSGNAGNDGVLRGPLNSVELTGSICADVDILALFYATPVVHIVQRLLGAGDVAHPLSARVVTTFPTLELVDSPALFGNKWTIEGFTATGGHSPYSLLVGVALTDIAEGDHGNFCVHSGSHMSLLEEYQAQVKRRSAHFSEDPAQVAKIDLGEPTQLIMRAGDVFLCSQRNAFLHTLNVGAAPTTIVYFRISHLDHGILKNTALESLWVEYKSASYYLEYANEAAAEEAQREIDTNTARQRAAQQKQKQQQQQQKGRLFDSPVAVAVPVPANADSSSAKPAAKKAPAGASAASAGAATVGAGGAAKSSATKAGGAPPKPSAASKPRPGHGAINTPGTAETKPKVFTAKQSSLLMDLLDGNRGKSDDLWSDAPLPKASSSLTSSGKASSGVAPVAAAAASPTSAPAATSAGGNTTAVSAAVATPAEAPVRSAVSSDRTATPPPATPSSASGNMDDTPNATVRMTTLFPATPAAEATTADASTAATPAAPALPVATAVGPATTTPVASPSTEASVTAEGASTLAYLENLPAPPTHAVSATPVTAATTEQDDLPVAAAIF